MKTLIFDLTLCIEFNLVTGKALLIQGGPVNSLSHTHAHVHAAKKGPLEDVVE